MSPLGSTMECISFLIKSHNFCYLFSKTKGSISYMKCILQPYGIYYYVLSVNIGLNQSPGSEQL